MAQQQQQAAKARAVARKVKDKWKSKVWFQVLAPDMFDRKILGELPCDETGERLKGRIVEATLHELSGDFSKGHIKVLCQIYEVRGGNAYTQFVGHDLMSDYVRRLTRRKKSKTDGVFDVETRDQFFIRVKPMAIADTRIQSSQRTQIRGVMMDTIKAAAEMRSHAEFISFMLSGEMAKALMKSTKLVHPLSRIDIRKSEVLRAGELPPFMEELPKPEPAPAPEGEATPAAEGETPAEAPAEPTKETPAEKPAD